jgi:hypothetical protein
LATFSSPILKVPTTEKQFGNRVHLSRQFVDLHLGKIEVHSFQGTEFVISLFKGNKHFNEDQMIKEASVMDAELLAKDSVFTDWKKEV